ncbi:Retrotransposon-derived protein PEG10 [Anabarilius grahami]|uniref:Retrotransposon-derived protein PEG10 n=1 Tax=Anabarilius grahami TaxID=495550 RepID=A0A3N0YC53_ANAGA|nr:Retrotransposon-derived protein PEG10 [Anabarilius grahami]
MPRSPFSSHGECRYSFDNKMKPLTTIVNLTAAGVSIPVSALLDSGSAGNFISGTLCRQLNLKMTATPSIYQVHSVTGRPLSRRRVRSSVGPVQLQVGILHVEQQHLLVLEESTADVILGCPWLEQHNPVISWKTVSLCIRYICKRKGQYQFSLRYLSPAFP